MNTGAHPAQETADAPTNGVRTVSAIVPREVTRLTDGVRHATIEDAPQLAWLRALSWQVAWEQGMLARAVELGDIAQVAARFRERMAQADVTVFCALRACRVVGYAAASACASPDGPEVRLDALHVDPALWHARIAENLVLSSATWALRQQARRVSMELLADNAGMADVLLRQDFALSRQFIRQRRLVARYELSLD